MCHFGACLPCGAADVGQDDHLGKGQEGIVRAHGFRIGDIQTGSGDLARFQCRQECALVDVVRYARPITGSGFVFMDTPGYDPVSLTGMVAGGANVICFTTGRGSVYGCRPVPSIKLATNSLMYHHMREDMDLNCGAAIDGDATVEELGRQIFDLLLKTASGRKSKSESFGVGDHEFVPWQLGAVM